MTGPENGSTGLTDETMLDGVFVHRRTARVVLPMTVDGIVHPFNPTTGDLYEDLIGELNLELTEGAEVVQS